MSRHAVDAAETGGFRVRVDPSWLLIAALVVWSLGSGYSPGVVSDLDAVVDLGAARHPTLGDPQARSTGTPIW